jgi:uncharacterized membrane protein YebE (DUF533 family)
MNPDFLINGVLTSILGGGRRKRSRRALRYLTGSSGSFWSRPQTLLTAAGLAWGVFESMQQQPGGQWGGGTASAAPAPAAGAVVPPLPAMAATDVNAEALRIVQLAISAANADGVMSEQERAAVLSQAQSAGVGEIVEREINHRRPLVEIVGDVTDAAQAATLYVLAFGVLRADEQVTGAERIYLAQLAHLLHLDPATVQQLEKDAGERIDAQEER